MQSLKHWWSLLQANQKLASEIERALRGGNPAATPMYTGAHALQAGALWGKDPLLAAQALGMPLRIEHLRVLEIAARGSNSAQAWNAYATAGRALLAIQAQLSARITPQVQVAAGHTQTHAQPQTVGTSVITKWAEQAASGVNTVAQGRNVLLRERAAMYRSGLNPYFANRQAFEDDLLAKEFNTNGIKRLVAFLEIPAVMKPVNDLVGHVQADDVLKGVMSIAAQLAGKYPDVTLYHLSAARFALEGPEQATREFSSAWAAELEKGELGYITGGMQYTRIGLPVVQHEQMANSASSRRGLLFQAMDALDQKANALKGTTAEDAKAGKIISPNRGDPLLGMTQTNATGQPNQAWFPARPLNPGADASRPTSTKDRVVDLLSAPMRSALQSQVEQLNTVPELIAAIQQTVIDGFSTDPALGAHLGNQLAYDREVNARQSANEPVYHGFVDVGGVGLTNTQISRFGGDAVLSAVHATAAAVARRVNDDMERNFPELNRNEDQIQVFAVGGDEIRFIGTSQRAVDAFALRFRVAMKDTTIVGHTGEDADKTPRALKGISLADIPVYIGTGETEHAAEAASNEAKATDPNRKPGTLPPGYTVVNPQTGTTALRADLDRMQTGLQNGLAEDTLRRLRHALHTNDSIKNQAQALLKILTDGRGDTPKVVLPANINGRDLIQNLRDIVLYEVQLDAVLARANSQISAWQNIQNKKRPIVVFDLDDTMLASSPGNFIDLNELISNPDAESMAYDRATAAWESGRYKYTRGMVELLQELEQRGIEYAFLTHNPADAALSKATAIQTYGGLTQSFEGKVLSTNTVARSTKSDVRIKLRDAGYTIVAVFDDAKKDQMTAYEITLHGGENFKMPVHRMR